MSADCIFCRIVAGALPAVKVYEDADTLAFMDIGPVVKGHTLVIPKTHCETISDAPVSVLPKLILAVQKIARAQFAGLQAAGVNVTQANGRAAGQVVPHLHFHVIPRPDGSPGLFQWKPGKYDSTAEMQQFADRIHAALS